MPMQWEYKTTKIKLTGLFKNKVDPATLDAVLNQFGQDRWELVAAEFLQAELANAHVLVIFKRPQQDSDDVSDARGVCPQCNYDMRGADHAACPECGWDIET